MERLARTRQAVHNNALWCDAVCRTHNRPGVFSHDIWVNRYETPQFYPNAVTLSGYDGADAQLASIRDLLGAGIAGNWAVKDSYCTLDLEPVGFQILFEAEWLWKPASPQGPSNDIPGVRWTRVESPVGLAAWETAWGGAADLPLQRTFLPTLLKDHEIAVLAAYQDQQIIAGVIANRTGDVVGLSNVFVPAQDGEPFRAGCVAAVSNAFPGLPIVGYESGAELEAALELGFERSGRLRIWVRQR